MKLIRVGIIVNTHGLKGEVKIKSMSHFGASRFGKGSILYIKEKDEVALKVLSSRMMKDMYLVTFEGKQDINLVEQWKGQNLYVHSDELPQLDEDEVYFHELMDCKVIDQDNHMIGVVTEIIESGAHAIIRVKNEEREVLIPFVKAFVKEVHADTKKIVVEMMEGL